MSGKRDDGDLPAGGGGRAGSAAKAVGERGDLCGWTT